MKGVKIDWRYAIGEFLIIVFGIVAAFQVDAGKERIRNNDLLTEYLADIEVGLRSDSMLYELAIEYFEQIEQEIDTTKRLFAQRADKLPASERKSLR